MPGIEPADLQVEIFQDRLTIAGERKIAAPEEAYRYHRRERRAGEFRRVLRLPFEVDRQSGRASCEDGILTVELEKAEQAKPRSIQVGA